MSRKVVIKIFLILTVLVTWGIAENPGIPGLAGLPAKPAVDLKLIENPVDDFRQLLLSDPASWAAELKNRPEAKRRILIQKLKEYSALPASEREHRLQVLQLRFYLVPLMEIPHAERLALLNAIPVESRKTIQDRLQEWDLLPMPLQKEVLERETFRQYFLRLEKFTLTEQHALLLDHPPERRQKLEAELTKWRALSKTQKEKLGVHFNAFFELSESEKHKTLQALSEAERGELEEVLRTFARLPSHQRQSCVESFQKFANLSSSERERFLKSAERWQSLTPNERQTWREIVTALPPLPEGFNSAPPPPFPGR
jgi:hypothetical protein